jgi:GTP-binding protein LepA
LVFDSWFDAYRGVIVLVRVMQGTMRKGQRIRLMSNSKSFEVESMGVLMPKPVEIGQLSAGEVGFFAATIKTVGDTKIGDTVTEDARPATAQLPGFEDIKPMVFAGLYTVDSHEHTLLRDALEKLRLNDSSFFFEPESSVALGFGFRCGFLGLLHMEIIQERLEREYELDLITTAPGVRYHIKLTDGSTLEVDNPSRWPEPTNIEEIREPVITAKILTNEEYVGGIFKLVEEKRGKQLNFEYVTPTRVMLTYELPLNEIVLDFYDRLKSISRGYASLDYQAGYTGLRRARRCALHHRPSRLRLRTGQGAGLEDARTDPPPAVRGRHPGGHRGQGHLPRDGQSVAQECVGQVLWRRHHAKAQVVGKAKGRQETNEEDR